MIFGLGRPASAAACPIVGTMNCSIVRGPAKLGSVPSASSPVTCSARGPIAATYTGNGVPPANANETGMTPGSTAVSSSPWKSTVPFCWIERSTNKCSRNRCTVLAAEMPKAFCSMEGAPRPSPRLKLPCEAADAMISGCRGLIGTTEVPSPRPGTAKPTSAANATAS